MSSDDPGVSLDQTNLPVWAKVAGEYAIDRLIVVPADLSQWKAAEASRGRAEAVQLENRRKFQEAFNEGMTVLGFLRDADGNGVFELGPIPKDPSELQ